MKKAFVNYLKEYKKCKNAGARIREPTPFDPPFDPLSSVSRADSLPRQVAWSCDPSGKNERLELKKAAFYVRAGIPIKQNAAPGTIAHKKTRTAPRGPL